MPPSPDTMHYSVSMISETSSAHDAISSTGQHPSSGKFEYLAAHEQPSTCVFAGRSKRSRYSLHAAARFSPEGWIRLVPPHQRWHSCDSPLRRHDYLARRFVGEAAVRRLIHCLSRLLLQPEVPIVVIMWPAAPENGWFGRDTDGGVAIVTMAVSKPRRGRFDEQRGEQAANLVVGQRDHAENVDVVGRVWAAITASRAWWCGAGWRPRGAGRGVRRPWWRTCGPSAGPVRAFGGRSDAAAAMTRQDHAQPRITAGQRPRDDFWHPTGGLRRCA